MQLARKRRDGGVGRGLGSGSGSGSGGESSRMRPKREDLYVYSRSRRRSGAGGTAAGTDTDTNGSDNADLDPTRNTPKKTKSESHQRLAERNTTKPSQSICKRPLQKSTTTSCRSDDSRHGDAEFEEPPVEKVLTMEMEMEPVVDNGIADTPTLKVEHPATDPAVPPSTPPPLSYQLQETQNRLQNIVDLVMWKDVSRSAFVFGFGSFLLISSSLARDVPFSIISVLSYMGLIYLAVSFFYKSLNCRKNNSSKESNTEYSPLVGEEEAICFLHFILPYLNVVIFKLRDLFSGEPENTLKLGVVLFVLARCGNSITIWNMAKLGFLGVFSLPKVCSLYSTAVIRYGNFWKRRFEDAWDSCSNKKIVLLVIFSLIWNLSSFTARIWAAFMLAVVVRCYQRSLCLPKEDLREQHQDGCGESAQSLTN